MKHIFLWLALLTASALAQENLGTVGPEVAGQVGVYRFDLNRESPGAGQIVEIWRQGKRVGDAFVVQRASNWLLNLKGVFVCLPGDQVMLTGRSASAPTVSEDRSRTTPDLLQEQAQLPDGGSQYCCPAAVANSLLWLADNGYPTLGGEPLQLMQELGQLMGTDENGTNMRELRKGLEAYLAQRQLHGTTDFRGWLGGKWQLGPNPHPSLDWLRQCLQPKCVAWLNFGFYTYDSGSDTYTRTGGHWVTLVGVSAAGRVNVHDPARRAGLTPSTQSVQLEELRSGTLSGPSLSPPLPARGYFRVVEGLALPRSRPVAVLDGVVSLRLP